MKKINEYYRLNNYDPRVLGSSDALGKRKNIIYQYDLSEDDLDDETDLEIEDHISSVISKKIGMNKYVSDPGNRKDNATLSTNNHMSIFEYAGDHGNYAVKGMIPNFSYRSNNNTKGPALGTQASATYIRNRPGRKSGTQYGTSRKHKILTDIEDDNIFNSDDLLSNLEMSFKRHNNKTKKILSIIKEYLKNDL